MTKSKARCVTCNDEDWAIITATAKSMGLSVSSFLRQIALEKAKSLEANATAGPATECA